MREGDSRHQNSILAPNVTDKKYIDQRDIHSRELASFDPEKLQNISALRFQVWSAAAAIG